MIVISGALVAVAFILLAIGILGHSLTYVYASIGVSLIAFVFLAIGVIQRRKEGFESDAEGASEADTLAAPDAAADSDSAVAPVRRPAGATTVVPDAVGADAGLNGTVLVVAGRPRYHVEGCRYLTGKSAEPVELGRAVDEGFTACGVCKPDATLAAAADAAGSATDGPDGTTGELASDGAAQAEGSTALGATDAAAEAEPAVRGRAARTSAASSRAAKAAPAARAARVSSSARTSAPKSPTRAAATQTPAAAPTKAAKAIGSVAASKASAAPKRGGVIVIPDRGKFHKADCRYVRGATGTLELTRAQAVKQGYAACGVCSS